MKRYSIIWMILFPMVFGCDAVATDDLSPTISLKTPVYEPIPPTRGAHPLLTHADFDRLEESLDNQSKRAELKELYQELMQQRPDDVLLQVRGLTYRLRGGDFREAATVTEQIMALERKHPKNPDVLFLLGLFHCARMNSGIVSGFGLPGDLITGVFSTVDPIMKGSVNEVEQRREGVMSIVQSWGSIAMKHSDYRGPGGITAMELGLRAKAFLISMESQLEKERVPSSGGEVSASETKFWEHAIQFHMALREGDQSGACQHGEEAFETLEMGRETALYLDKTHMGMIQKWGLGVTLHTASDDVEAFRTLATKTCGWE